MRSSPPATPCERTISGTSKRFDQARRHFVGVEAQYAKQVEATLTQYQKASKPNELGRLGVLNRVVLLETAVRETKHASARTR